MVKKRKIFIGASLLLNVFLVLVLVFVIGKLGGISFIQAQASGIFSDSEKPLQETAYYKQRNSLFDELEIKRDSTVMLGDSLIQYNEWNEIFTNDEVLNRGIGGDTTLGVLKRLDTIVEQQPKNIVLMIGINDLALGIPMEETVKNYREIIKHISSASPDTRIVVNSVLPINNEFFGDSIDNANVEELNKEIKKIAQEGKAQYVDIYPTFVKDGQLADQYTVDGVHLTGEGYLTWIEALKRVIN